MRGKIEEFIKNCIKCILAEKKQGKIEGRLNPIDKGEQPLDTYHIDHLGPIPSTRKNYNHLFVVINSFTKFSWIYPTKSTNAEEAILGALWQTEVRHSHQIYLQNTAEPRTLS